VIRAAAAAALLLALAAPAAALAAGALPATATVDLGGAPGYVRADAGSPLAGVQLFVRAGLDRQSGSQNGLAALTAEAVLRTPVDGVALTDAITARGGSLEYFVAPRYVRFHLQAAPAALAGLTPLLARALTAPATDPATLSAARAALGARIAEDERNPVLAGLGMVRASFYRDGPGQPPLGTPGALTAFAPADVQAFHDRWYVRGSAYLAEVGRTGPASDAAARALVAALPAGTAPAAPVVSTRPFVKEPRRLVTRRDIGSPYVVLGFAAPDLGSRDFAAALVVRALLGEVLERPGATTLSPQRRGIGTIYGYDVAPAQFALWINGAQIDPSTGLGTLAAVVKAAAQKPLAPAVLARYKETARGAWRLESVTLEDRAWAIGNAVAQGLDPSALDTIPAAVDAVTAADVQRVAKRWFQQFDVALVLPRAGGG
jgi:zinc protease